MITTNSVKSNMIAMYCDQGNVARPREEHHIMYQKHDLMCRGKIRASFEQSRKIVDDPIRFSPDQGRGTQKTHVKQDAAS